MEVNKEKFYQKSLFRRFLYKIETNSLTLRIIRNLNYDITKQKQNNQDMKLTVKFLIIAMAIFFAMPNSYGQRNHKKYKKGYIIEHDSLKVEGYVRVHQYHKRGKYCTFRENFGGIQLTYLPFEIIEYGRKGYKFVARRARIDKSTRKKIFAQVLEEGKKANFYRYLYTKELKKLYYVESEIGTLELLTKDNYKDILHKTFEGNAKLQKCAKKVKFKERKIKKLIRKFNKK